MSDLPTFKEVNEQAKQTAKDIIAGKVLVINQPSCVNKKYFDGLVRMWLEQLKGGE